LTFLLASPLSASFRYASLSKSCYLASKVPEIHRLTPLLFSDFCFYDISTLESKGTYYKKAKQLGSPYGTYNFAENLYKGIGTETNKKEAVKILKKLAKSKFKPAEKFLKKIKVEI
jgi:TPR repeat protein